MPWGETGYLRWFPPLTWQCEPQIAGVVKGFAESPRIVDLGAGGRVIAPKHCRLDPRPMSHTTVVAVGEHLPFLPASLDLVIATGLLEHVADHRVILGEIYGALRAGGVVHVEVPFLQQYHEDPIDCRRFTVFGLERELVGQGFSIVKSGMHIGPTVTLTTLGAHYIHLWCEGRSRAAKAIATVMFFGWSVAMYPLKFADRWLVHKPGAHRLAFGVYATGMKRSPEDGRVT